VPALLFLAGLALIYFGSARPQAQLSLPHVEGTVILAFDVSGSMAATDLKPTRMDAAKAAAKDFVKHQPSTVRIGIVAFSDSGLSVQAPSDDRDAILASIDRLSPSRGTSLGNGMLVSLSTLASAGEPVTHLYSNLTPVPATATPQPVAAGSDTSSAIVLLTDGENNERPDPLDVAKAAADRGVRIYTVGIGSAAGTTLHVNGFTVHTQLDEPTLKEIARITGGFYYNADSATELSKVYGHLAPELSFKPEKTEITAMFAGAGVLVLLVGGLLSLLWFSRFP
jgi:Ca-activated chloride channel family protein